MLALIGAVNAAIGGWYYLRHHRRDVPAAAAASRLTPRHNLPGLTTTFVCAVLTVGLSVPPLSTWLLSRVKDAAGTPAPANLVARQE